jgi:cytochrome c biogenesis protein CcmG, thiol:disulfide interchange protein DsbE
MRTAAIVLACAALVAVVVIGLSQAGSQGGEPKKGKTPTGAAAQAVLRGAPPQLGALHRQAGQLLGGGKAAFTGRRKALHDFPLVVNGWASWCGPCRFEFPFFQSQAVKQGRRVAFLGLDVTDNASDARRFLRQFPQPYPSYTDTRGTIMQSLVPSSGLPNTVFFDANGKQTFVHQGGYPSEGRLAADIRRYALGG